jgi:hypothetical protein
MLKEKPVDQWSKEEIEAAEIVCHTYDAVGQMVRHHLLPRGIIIDSWGPSLRNGWPTLSRLIQKYRKDHAAPELWDDYEWLAIQATRLERRRQRIRLLWKHVGVRQLIMSVGSRITRARSAKQPRVSGSKYASRKEPGNSENGA